MKSLILCLLSVVMLAACAIDAVPVESSTEQGICTVFVCDEYGCYNEIRGGCGPTGGTGGGGTGGGGGGGSPTTPFPTCSYTALCMPEECASSTASCQLCQMQKTCSDGSFLTWNDYTCYPNASCGY